MDAAVETPKAGQEETSPKREWVKNPKGLSEFYGNYLHSNWSLFDTRILLGQLKPSIGDSSTFVIEEQAAIILSWAQTKNLAAILAGMVKAYESVNGEIVKPKLAPRYEDMPKDESK